MDSLSTAELLEVAMNFRNSLDNQFQYWLTITFAVLVAGFVAGPKLSTTHRRVITILYFLAAALFFTRTLVDVRNFGIYIQAATERGAEWYSTLAPMLIGGRSILYILGTSITLWFLNSDKRRNDA
jgi:hypothetical protein